MEREQTKAYNNFLMLMFGSVVLLLIMLAFVVPKGEEVLYINSRHNPSLDAFSITITRLGEGWIFVPLIVLALFRKFYVSVMGLTMAVINGLVCAFAKRVLFAGSARPKMMLDNSLLYFVPGIEVHSNYSFPSGHSATIFCAAVFACILLRHRLASVLVLILALAVCYTRIYLLQHFLIDVAGGALIGAGVAFSASYLFETINRPAWMNQLLQVRVSLQRQGA